MMAVGVESKRWNRRHWWLAATLVFTGQLTLIFSLSDRKPFVVRPPAPAPILRLAGQASAELLALLDPTLFALPSAQGFSAVAWAVSSPRENRFVPPAAPVEYLLLPLQSPGADFNQYVATNRFEPPPPRPELTPEFALPALTFPPVSLPPSTVRIEGPLALRRLIKPIFVPSWPHGEILTNTVIQVGVNSEGRSVSFGALLARSGSAEADQYALKVAREARFESISASGPSRPPDPGGAPVWGKLVFEWHTVPITSSNLPAANPQ